MASSSEARDQFREALRTEQDRFPIHMQLLQLDLQLARLPRPDHADAEETMSPVPDRARAVFLYNGIALSQLSKHDAAIETLVTGRDVVVDNSALLAHPVLEQLGRRLQRSRAQYRRFRQSLRQSACAGTGQQSPVPSTTTPTTSASATNSWRRPSA
jgi:hypothetical protein